ncbi:uncharacterized protein BDW47DRAFT_121175 [Aspergillus candidus]|uniref:Secreted protein n=1 Tax=Aspergillus candidus TaxID=41067 RepID=A0A2I2EYQ5_ASPCN|nr:hypothetical protein BDW47DRAFT_121175 [Aspergillus candidus]PLB33508.1 hypothetical protein BDW47DRAFT_121175 [Aspergillus candidus]
MGSLLVLMMVHRMCTRLFCSLTRIFTPSTEAPGFLYRQFQSPNNGRLRVNVIDTRDEGAWGQGPFHQSINQSSDSFTHCMHVMGWQSARRTRPVRRAEPVMGSASVPEK